MSMTLDPRDLLDRQLGRVTMYRLITIVLSVLVAVYVVFSATGIIDGLSVKDQLVTLVVLLVASYASSRLFGAIWRVRPHGESAIITALLLFFLYVPLLETDVENLAWLAGAAVLGNASKYVLAWRGRHIFNPAAAGAFLVLARAGRRRAGEPDQRDLADRRDREAVPVRRRRCVPGALAHAPARHRRPLHRHRGRPDRRTPDGHQHRPVVRGRAQVGVLLVPDRVPGRLHADRAADPAATPAPAAGCRGADRGRVRLPELDPAPHGQPARPGRLRDHAGAVAADRQPAGVRVRPSAGCHVRAGAAPRADAGDPRADVPRQATGVVRAGPVRRADRAARGRRRPRQPSFVQHRLAAECRRPRLVRAAGARELIELQEGAAGA